MPDDYLRSIEPLDRDRLRWAYAVAPPRPNPTALSLPSSGVSSLDLGRLWQRRRPFFFVYAVTFAAILRRHRFSNPQHGRRACSCHIGKQRENHMAKTNYQVTFNGKVVDIRKRDRIYNRTGQRLDLLGGQCPRWVKTGKAQWEHMFSALPPTTDIERPRRHVRVVPEADLRPASAIGAKLTPEHYCSTRSSL